MKPEAYKDLIPSSLHEKLKFDEKERLEKTSNLTAGLLIISALSGLVFVLALIAWLIWGGKFALFVFSSFSVIFAFNLVITIRFVKSNTKTIKNFIETLKERE